METNLNANTILNYLPCIQPPRRVYRGMSKNSLWSDHYLFAGPYMHFLWCQYRSTKIEKIVPPVPFTNILKIYNLKNRTYYVYLVQLIPLIGDWQTVLINVTINQTLACKYAMLPLPPFIKEFARKIFFLGRININVNCTLCD